MAQLLPAWVLLILLYLLLAGDASGQEVVAGILAAGVGAGSAVLVPRFGGSRGFRFRLAWLRRLPPLFAALALDLGQVGRLLLRALAGDARPAGIVRQPFAPGGTAPEDAARRALVVLGASFAPNSFAVGIAPDTLLLHRLAPRPIAADREWPI